MTLTSVGVITETEKVAASYVFIVLDEPVMFIRKTENAVCGSKGSECKHEK